MKDKERIRYRVQIILAGLGLVHDDCNRALGIIDNDPDHVKERDALLAVAGWLSCLRVNLAAGKVTPFEVGHLVAGEGERDD